MGSEHPLGPFLRRFLLEDVVEDRNLTRNTQQSYRDAIRLLLEYIAEYRGIEPTKVMVEQVTPDLVRDFLAHLEAIRGNSITTRNQRLVAIRSLFRFIARQVPELVEHASQIRSMVPKRTALAVIPYLDKHEVDALLAVPDRKRTQGRRDYALLLFLYNTGARASEAATVMVGDLSLDTSPSVRLLGKGRKIRLCPLWRHTSEVLTDLLGPGLQGPQDSRVFLNVRRQPITRFGIHALLKRTVARAATCTPSLRRKRVSPHTMRHTTAVHLLRAGVDINTIRAWLGHVSLETTNRYAEVDLEMKAKALEACAIRDLDPPDGRTPTWYEEPGLMAFLTSL